MFYVVTDKRGLSRSKSESVSGGFRSGGRRVTNRSGGVTSLLGDCQFMESRTKRDGEFEGGQSVGHVIEGQTADRSQRPKVERDTMVNMAGDWFRQHYAVDRTTAHNGHHISGCPFEMTESWE